MPSVNFSFGPFAFDLDRQFLLKHGCPVVLGQRGAALLGALLQANGMPVTKSELMDAAWPELHVEESNLSVQIASLRKTLGKAPSGGDWIETLQRNGYRFAKLDSLQPRAKEFRGQTSSKAPTLAILPFANLSNDSEQGFFADGLTDDLTTALARVPGLAVMTRYSSSLFRDVDAPTAAKSLNVRYIAGGSVRRSGERLRISAELVDTELSRTLWADRFDRKATDIFAVQDELAHQIATFIFNTVLPTPLIKLYRTPSLEAYELIVKSRPMIASTFSANRQAAACYRRAIELDPNYPEAHWMLSVVQIHWWCQFGGDRNLAQKEALSLARRAFQLDETDPGVYEVMGLTLTKHGKHEEALDWYQRGLSIDPTSANCHNGIGQLGLLSGNVEQALSAFTLSIGLSPFPPWWHFDHLGRAQLFAGDIENALITLTRPDIVREFSGSFVASAFAAAGLQREAHQTVAEFQKFQPHWRIERWISNEFFQNDAAADFWRQAFLKAGLPK